MAATGVERLREIVERAASGAALAAACPVIAAAGMITWAVSGRSPFITHERVGAGGRTLRLLKLRTMWGDGTGRQWRWVEHVRPAELPGAKGPGDPRVMHGFAAWCRRYSVDELPQLWHVVKGEMSLVGPRPLTKVELDHYYGRDLTEVVSVKPGITGLWQAYGRSRLTYPQRRRLDLFWVRRRTHGLYWRVLLQTVRKVVSGEGAW